MRRNRANQQRRHLPGHQVAESTLIRNSAMAQQLCEHPQSLIGEILIDEGFLSGQSLSSAARWLIVVFLARCGDLREKLGNCRQAELSFPLVRGILGLSEDELST